MATKDASWMDEVAKSKPRRPSNPDRPLLPFVLSTVPTLPAQRRSHSYSAGQNRSSQPQLAVRAAWNPIAEEALSDDSDEFKSTTDRPISRRQSNPLIQLAYPQHPWHETYSNGPAMEPAFPAIPRSSAFASSGDASRMQELSQMVENIIPPSTGVEMSHYDVISKPSFTEFPYFKGSQIGSPVTPYASGGLEKQCDAILGKRSEADHQNRRLLYAVVEFKLSRTDIYHFETSVADVITSGSRVVVAADRGLDLGLVRMITSSANEAQNYKRVLNRCNYEHLLQSSKTGRPPGWNTDTAFQTYNEFNTSCSYAGAALPQGMPLGLPATKAVIRVARDHEEIALITKADAEERAKKLCIAATERHGLHLHDMEILAAEYQFDYNKLTFYFVSPQYLHFNSLVTELFKIFKTRIWMSALNPASCVPPSAAHGPRGPPGWHDNSSAAARARQVFQPRLRGMDEHDFDSDQRTSMMSSLDLDLQV